MNKDKMDNEILKKEMIHDMLKNGKKYIASLPDIDDLRGKALDTHLLTVRAFEMGLLDYNEAKYGFVKAGFDYINKYERKLLQDLILNDEKCNCNQIIRIGETTMIVLDGTEHTTWCDKARQFNNRYLRLIERLSND